MARISLIGASTCTLESCTNSGFAVRVLVTSSISAYTASLRKQHRLVPEERLELSRIAPRDFESRAYTNSATPARFEHHTGSTTASIVLYLQVLILA